MSDKKGNYSAVPTDEDDLTLTQTYPPPYTPSAASSPFIVSHQAVAGPSTQVYNPAPQQPPQPVCQPPKPANITQSRSPPGCVTSPLILTTPPCRIEDLKTKPRVVVCQHCHYLVLTETSHENGSCTVLGILALFLAGVTSCGCCLLPLCMSSCKDIMHSCPNCHEDIGLFVKLQDRTLPVRHS